MNMILSDWILTETKDCETVVEFGAGSFRRLEDVHPSVKRRIGIEISQAYINTSPDMREVEQIKGDMRKFESLIPNFYSVYDCAMFIDSLEHLTRKDALDLMSRVMILFNRIILMIPEGIHIQESDITGHGQHEFQKHRSTWYEKDIRAMGFKDVTVDEDFHKNKIDKANGCIFAVWERESIKKNKKENYV